MERLSHLLLENLFLCVSFLVWEMRNNKELMYCTSEEATVW